MSIHFSETMVSAPCMQDVRPLINWNWNTAMPAACAYRPPPRRSSRKSIWGERDWERCASNGPTLESRDGTTRGDWGWKSYDKTGLELNCNLTHREQLHDTSNRWRLGVTVILMRELNCNSWITVKLSAAIFWNWLAAALTVSNYS